MFGTEALEVLETGPVIEEALADAAPLTGEKVVVSFIRLAGGGTVLGWLVGQVAVIAIANIIDDASLEITITLTAAYGAFFLVN